MSLVVCSLRAWLLSWVKLASFTSRIVRFLQPSESELEDGEYLNLTIGWGNWGLSTPPQCENNSILVQMLCIFEAIKLQLVDSTLTPLIMVTFQATESQLNARLDTRPYAALMPPRLDSKGHMQIYSQNTHTHITKFSYDQRYWIIWYVLYSITNPISRLSDSLLLLFIILPCCCYWP